jgi:integrase
MPLKLIPPRAGKTPYWSVRGTHLGVYVDKSTKLATKAKAAKLLAAWRDDIERDQFAKPGEATFLTAAVAYMEAGGERTYMAPLLEHFGETPLRRIDQAAIDGAALKLYPEASPATRNRQVYTVVSAVLKRAGIERPLRRPKGSQGQQRTDWLWPEQAFALFKSADEIDAEFGVFLRLLCYTGLRLSEALNLRWNDVRLDEGFAYVGKTKSGDPRAVFLTPGVVDILGQHRATQPQHIKDRIGERVFRFTKSGRLYHLLRVSKAAANLPRVGFHVMRHTWATWMRRYAGLDTKGLMGTGAWRDHKSASRYEHVVVSEESARAAMLPIETSVKSVETP